MLYRVLTILTDANERGSTVKITTCYDAKNEMDAANQAWEQFNIGDYMKTAKHRSMSVGDVIYVEPHDNQNAEAMLGWGYANELDHNKSGLGHWLVVDNIGFKRFPNKQFILDWLKLPFRDRIMGIDWCTSQQLIQLEL